MEENGLSRIRRNGCNDPRQKFDDSSKAVSAPSPEQPGAWPMRPFVHHQSKSIMDIAVPSMSSNLHTYTPVRRRDSTINSRLLHGVDQEQEWTAARCHRLLRALTSRVAILKKDLVRFQSARNGHAWESKTNAQPGSRADDAEWTKAKKRIRQTYSGRGGKNGPESRKDIAQAAVSRKERKSMAPGEVTVPTPILIRARGEMPSPQHIPSKTYEEPRLEDFKVTKRPRGRGVDGDFQFHPSETLRDLRQTISATRYTTYEGIYNGLEGLLRATISNGSDEKPKAKGARSLLSMALKAVPKYIAQQEGLLESHMEEFGCKTALDQRDISTEIYDELESFGSSNRGWKKLKTIVRAHGIQVINDAIHLGLLDDGFCGVLIALCVNCFAIEEAQSLLSALLSSRKYPGPKTLYDTPSRPLSMLWKFTEFTSRPSFKFRELSNILSVGRLPVEWLATKEFGPIWTSAIQLLAPGLTNDDAFVFLDSALSLLSVAGGPSSSATKPVAEAVKNTFCSVLTTLTSVAILSREARNGRVIEGSGSGPYGDASALLRGCMATNRLSIHSDARIPLLLSNLISHDAQDFGAKTSLMDTILSQLHGKSGTTGVARAYTQAVTFICQIAHCCGRGSAGPGFGHLEQMHLLLESMASDKDASNVVQGLIVDSAFMFAQKSPHRKHLDYAATMDAKFCARRIDVDASLHEVSEGDTSEDTSGFRWEEGIGEWVTATPAIHVAKRKAAALKSFADVSECDTPYRPPPKLRRQTEAGPAFNPTPIVLPSSPVISSGPVIDNSIGVYPLRYSPSPPEHNDNASDSRIPTRDKSTQDESEDELAEDPFQSGDFSDSGDQSSQIEVSFAESSMSYASSASMVTTVSKGRHSIDRVPRLNRKLLRRSEDFQFLEDPFASSASSVKSNTESASSERRELIDRAPRLGRKAHRSSQAWQIFDESDDELSFLSASSQNDHASWDLRRTGRSNARCRRKFKPILGPKTRARASKVTHLRDSDSDSEDELCI
ncbi:hypothetical protein LZ554_006182 [Drepanopeziza brunnea f. sp. 'monogermtubi']|nr:hypothetical protein LZ554_006182 [Drepanopeziza brunnea f. sp. 'monogermtubi']